MLIDMNIGGPFDGTAGGDIATTVHQIRDAVDGASPECGPPRCPIIHSFR